MDGHTSGSARRVEMIPQAQKLNPIRESENGIEQTQNIPASNSESPRKSSRARSASAHWSRYPLPGVKVVTKVRPVTSAHNLQRLRDGGQQLCIGKEPEWLPCEDAQLHYCLLCGSPGHVGKECDRSNGHKYHNGMESGSRSEKGGGITCETLDENYENWAKDDTKLLSAASSMTDLSEQGMSCRGGSVNERKYMTLRTYPKSLDTVLLRRNTDPGTTSPQRACRPSTRDFQASADVESKKEMPFLASRKSESRPGNVLSENRARPSTSAIAKQGAQVRLRTKTPEKSEGSLRTEGDDYKDSTDRVYSTSVPPSMESDESVALICGTLNGVETTMLLDTGSSISAITETFAHQLKLKTWVTRDTLVVTLANTHVERYPERTCLATLRIGDHETYEEFSILPGQIYNVTLGKSWLKRHKAIVDYDLDLMRLPGSRPIRLGASASLEPVCCCTGTLKGNPGDRDLHPGMGTRHPHTEMAAAILSSVSEEECSSGVPVGKVSSKSSSRNSSRTKHRKPTGLRMCMDLASCPVTVPAACTPAPLPKPRLSDGWVPPAFQK